MGTLDYIAIGVLIVSIAQLGARWWLTQQADKISVSDHCTRKNAGTRDCASLKKAY